MWTLLPVRPNNEDNPVLPESQASQPEFPIGFAVVFVRDHWRVEGRFDFCDVDPVLLEIRSALGLIPSDHAQIVYTN